MTEAELEEIETASREARSGGKMREIGTHWPGCWTAHPSCAVPLVEQLVAEVRACGHRQVTLDRIIVKMQGLVTGLTDDDKNGSWDAEEEVEFDRIGKVWNAENH